ncbi:MAG: WD40 repeat domain-containing protein [Bacteroidetes bacterium]|nr:MAG: WD40 repeat domain-containing protein [Bacteroidota bacterium]
MGKLLLTIMTTCLGISALLGQELETFIPNACEGGAMSLVFSEEGDFIYTAGKSEYVKKWRVEDGKPVAVSPALGDQMPQIIRVGDHLFVGGRQTDILILNETDLTLESRWPGHTYFVEDLDFCAKSRRLASVSRDNSFRLWDAANGENIQTIAPGRADLMAVALSPDGQLAAFADAENEVFIHKINTSDTPQIMRGSRPVRKLAFSPDGRWLVGAAGNQLLVWEVETRALVHRFRGHVGGISDFIFLPDGQHILSAGLDRKVILRNLQTGRVRFSFMPHEAGISALAFDTSNQRLATAAVNGEIKIWRLSLLPIQPLPEMNQSEKGAGF